MSLTRDTQIAIQKITLLASATITANRFVDADGSPAAANGPAFGVAEEDAETGKLFPCVTDGLMSVAASAAITVNDEIAVATDGKAKTAVSTNHIVGIALEAATAADQNILVKLQYRGVKA